MIKLYITPQEARFEVIYPVFALGAHLSTLYGGNPKDF